MFRSSKMQQLREFWSREIWHYVPITLLQRSAALKGNFPFKSI